MGQNEKDAIDPGAAARVIHGLETKLFEIGVRVEYGTDFALLEHLLRKTSKERLTEHFSTALNTYTPANAYWLRAYSEDGETVAVGAVRLDDLGTMSLGKYIANYWHRCYPDAAGDGARASRHQPRFLSEVSGRVAYLGDLWVARLWQRKRIHEHLTPLAVVVTLQKWDPDWLYCWIRPGAWSKRYPMAYGFSAVHPVGIRWETQPVTIDPDLVMAVNKASWARDWLDHLADEFPLVSHSRPVE